MKIYYELIKAMNRKKSKLKGHVFCSKCIVEKCLLVWVDTCAKINIFTYSTETHTQSYENTYISIECVVCNCCYTALLYFPPHTISELTDYVKWMAAITSTQQICFCVCLYLFLAVSPCERARVCVYVCVRVREREWFELHWNCPE